VFWVVLPIHILASLFLIFVVLLQSGKGGDIASAFGGAGSQTVFGPRGSSNVLTKATAIAAAVFMMTSLALVVVSQEQRGPALDLEAEPMTAPVTSDVEPTGVDPTDTTGLGAPELGEDVPPADGGDPAGAPD
jgi:preprotein translocase subunit SecG